MYCQFIGNAEERKCTLWVKYLPSVQGALSKDGGRHLKSQLSWGAGGGESGVQGHLPAAQPVRFPLLSVRAPEKLNLKEGNIHAHGPRGSTCTGTHLGLWQNRAS